jgi:hypothetical protein
MADSRKKAEQSNIPPKVNNKRIPIQPLQMSYRWAVGARKKKFVYGIPVSSGATANYVQAIAKTQQTQPRLPLAHPQSDGGWPIVNPADDIKRRLKLVAAVGLHSFETTWGGEVLPICRTKNGGFSKRKSLLCIQRFDWFLTKTIRL